MPASGKQMLPIEQTLPRLCQTLRDSSRVVLSALPGAGKTTRVPLALLSEQWLEGRLIIMLEPRRLAARHAARFMAGLFSEEVGKTVGYRTRGESRVSAGTRIEVVTEGILTRMLQDNPDLPGVGLVIFDEFHERSIHADLGLALLLDVQSHLRDDIRILVMSATLDGVGVANLLDNAPVIESPGKSHPVELHYLPFPVDRAIEPVVASTVRRALQDGDGDVLVFLPGRREIERVMTTLTDSGLPDHVVIHKLFGEAADEVQRAALTPSPLGNRKIILSTSIAETSLTIEGVRIVVDSGLSRMSSFDARRGMSGLETVPVSQASATQRAGRCGREGPGICYRLWTKEQQEQLPPYTSPEILNADLAPLTLELARWGSTRGKGLRFLTPPPVQHLEQATRLLKFLGAMQPDGTLTQHGQALAESPVHPRYAHMILRGEELGLGTMACDVAALLEERDILRGEHRPDIDIASRWHALKTGRGPATQRIETSSQRLQKVMGVSSSGGNEQALGILVALAYPDRIARRRGANSNRYLMAGGTGAVLPEWSLLVREEFLAIAELDGADIEARVFLAAPLSREEIHRVFAKSMSEKHETVWNSAEEAVVSREVQMLGEMIVDEKRRQPEGDDAVAAMIDGIRQLGLSSLPWSREAESLMNRSEWLRLERDDDWPDLSNETLMTTIETWLAPFLWGITRRTHLANLDLSVVLRSLFAHTQLKDLERLAPEHLEAPTGSRIRLEYSPNSQPVMAVKLQEMFGQVDTPSICDGRTSVLVHLLSPAGRPLAVTQDLRSFWTNAYTDVRKQMRGRYPKHDWPENPLTAKPVRGAKRRKM